MLIYWVETQIPQTRSQYAPLQTSKEDSLEVNTEKTKCLLLHQNAELNNNLIITNKCLENMEKFKYLVMTVIKQTCIHKELKAD
jgi:hypothetical protein